MTILLERGIQHRDSLVRPHEVGLGNSLGQEIAAEWYSRQPYAPRVVFQARSTEPWAGGTWTIGFLLFFDGAGHEIARRPVSVSLCGAIEPPPLTADQIAFRQNRGIQADPYTGDSIVFTFK